jgi:hypothetical protein
VNRFTWIFKGTLFGWSPSHYFVHFVVDEIRHHHYHCTSDNHQPEGRLEKKEEYNSLEFSLDRDKVKVDANNYDVVSYQGHCCDNFGFPGYKIEAQYKFVADSVKDHAEGYSRLTKKAWDYSILRLSEQVNAHEEDGGTMEHRREHPTPEHLHVKVLATDTFVVILGLYLT